MREHSSGANQNQLQALLELTARVGSDPLLTQGSTGNSSMKLNGHLWIKASGKWMADAMRQDVLIPLDLSHVQNECLARDKDASERYPNASLETAMHAAIPHPVVLHVHCVKTIAWAVRKDAPLRLRERLEGLRWRWVPYQPSGLALCRAIERAMGRERDAEVFVLGNHGLVIGGEDPGAVEALLMEVGRRLAVAPRAAPQPDYEALARLSAGSPWELPGDKGVHVLGTDPVSRMLLTGGLLYPCQAIFSNARAPELFRPIPFPDDHREAWGGWRRKYADRPFLIVEGCGVLVQRTMTPAGLAMISGLANVVGRVSAAAPVRYLTEEEIAGVSGQVAYRYRELAEASHV